MFAAYAESSKFKTFVDELPIMFFMCIEELGEGNDVLDY